MPLARVPGQFFHALDGLWDHAGAFCFFMESRAHARSGGRGKSVAGGDRSRDDRTMFCRALGEMEHGERD